MIKTFKNSIITALITLPIIGSSFAYSIDPSYDYSNGDYDFNQGLESTCVRLTTNLKYKSSDYRTSGQVTDLQIFLYDKGFLTVEPNGYFGMNTFNAVKSYQVSKKLASTGYVGTLTRKAIESDSCPNKTITPIPPTITPTEVTTNNNQYYYYCVSEAERSSQYSFIYDIYGECIDNATNILTTGPISGRKSNIIIGSINTVNNSNTVSAWYNQSNTSFWNR